MRPMADRLPDGRSHLTLGLCTILHGFTHAYGSMLVPLYLAMQADLKLSGVGAASLVVSLYGAVYNLGSFGAGVIADRFDRKTLLAIGLLGNAAAIGGIGFCRAYPGILALGVAAGLFGTIFHPAANALATSHYPKSPGMAIGLLGIGSGLGFFFGPQYAGWRAHAAAWHLDHIAQWQKPCVELGIAGLVCGVVFLLVGRDPHSQHRRKTAGRLDPLLRRRVVHIACVLMFRDFAGVATISLAALYVQRAFGMGVEGAGLFVGKMMLPSVLVNPLCVLLTPRGRRLPGLAIILIAGGCIVVTTPLWPARFALLALCGFMTLQMGSYAVSDASILERVGAEVRGRVVGLFLVIAGTFGASGPWVMGAWTDWLGPRGLSQHGYFAPFGLMGIFMLVAAAAPKLIARLGEATTQITPAQEISPATMGSVV
jgi:MFS family permease